MATNISKLLDIISRNGSLLGETSGNGEKEQAAKREVIQAASALVFALEDPGGYLARVGWGEPSRTAALRTAFELGILAKLDMATPKTSAQLSEGTKADPELVARIMRHLAANSVVREDGRDQYLATPFVKASSEPDFAAGLIYSFEGMIPTLQGLPEFLAKTDYQVPHDDHNGLVQYGLRTDKSFFGVLQENQRLGAAFNRFMTLYARKRPRWVDFYPCEERLLHETDPSEGPLLVDVGGGLGGDISAFHTKNPTAAGRLILEDLSSTITQVASANPPLPAAVGLVAHDFFTPQPSEYRHARAYFLHLVPHDWPDDKCHAILSHLRDAMKPGYSKILINENVLPDTGAPWQQTSLDWTMMALLVSRERTRSQWSQILAAVGLKIVNIYSKDPTSESLIEATLVDD